MAKFLFLAPGFTLPFSPLSPEAFEEIKCVAGKTWKQHAQESQNCSTTYAGAFGRKGLDAPICCRAAPSSPTRVHKPHPKEVFLINQLHQLPGPYGTPRCTASAESGFCPNDTKKYQIKHKAVIVPSPLTPCVPSLLPPLVVSPLPPLGTIQQGIKHVHLNGNQMQEDLVPFSSTSQDILTGWSGMPSSHSSIQLLIERSKAVSFHP